MRGEEDQVGRARVIAMAAGVADGVGRFGPAVRIEFHRARRRPVREKSEDGVDGDREKAVRGQRRCPCRE